MEHSLSLVSQTIAAVALHCDDVLTATFIKPPRSEPVSATGVVHYADPPLSPAEARAFGFDPRWKGGWKPYLTEDSSDGLDRLSEWCSIYGYQGQVYLDLHADSIKPRGFVVTIADPALAEELRNACPPSLEFIGDGFRRFLYLIHVTEDAFWMSIDLTRDNCAAVNVQFDLPIPATEQSDSVLSDDSLAMLKADSPPVVYDSFRLRKTLVPTIERIRSGLSERIPLEPEEDGLCGLLMALDKAHAAEEPAKERKARAAKPSKASSKPDPATKYLGLNALIKKAEEEKQRDGFASVETMDALMNTVARQKNRVPIYERIKTLKITGMTEFKKEVEKLSKEHAKAAASKKRKKAAQDSKKPTICSGDDFPDQTAALLSGLRRLNDPPYVFLHGGDMKRLPGEAEQHSVGGFLKRMSFTDFKTECNSAVTFVAESEYGSDRVASLAEDIPAHLWGMRDKPVPVADRFTRVPVFGPDGTLRTEDGYDAATRTILQTSGLSLEPVPSEPSDADLATAKEWLLDNALADFPFVDDFGGSEGGDGSSSLAHILVMLLQQFARELYTGPTPFFFIDKPQPGTGASLLVELLYQIVVGRPASPQVLGKNEDEIRKGITTKLSSGSPIIFYDNVRNKIHGEALAILGTADWWEDRLLGGNETYVGPNRALTVFTGNNMTMADEMVRRMLPIRLDAKVPDPENRANFVIADLRNWMVENRSKLVWSCLVLIQNWIAKGMERSTAHLASYKDFAAIMGGILEAAGIGGFLGNLSVFNASAKIEANDESEWMQALINEKHPGIEFSTDDAHGIVFDPAGKLRYASLNIQEDDRAAQVRILGLRLGNHVGRVFNLIVNGKEAAVRFERAGKKDHSTRWQFTVMGGG